MVRTKDTAGVKVVGAKASRKASAPVPAPAPSGEASSSKNKHSGGNPYCPRETPQWQKPITEFFPSASRGESGTDGSQASCSKNTEHEVDSSQASCSDNRETHFTISTQGSSSNNGETLFTNSTQSSCSNNGETLVTNSSQGSCSDNGEPMNTKHSQDSSSSLDISDLPTQINYQIYPHLRPKSTSGGDQGMSVFSLSQSSEISEKSDASNSD